MKIALLALCVFLLAATFAGCKGGLGGKKYDYLVTFDYNVGNLQEDGVENCYLGVKENSLVVLQPGDSNFPGKTVQGYYVDGWHLPQTDAEGKAVVNDDGRVALGEEWNFEENRVTASITLYADLQPYRKLIVVGGDEEKVYDNSIYGDLINKPSVDSLKPRKEGYTFVDYYVDELCTIKFEWPYRFDEQEKTIYASFVEGDWQVVTTAAEFRAAYVANENIYLNDNIDFTGEEWEVSRNIRYRSELRGNDYEISNILLEREGNRASENAFALFGSIGGANIHDVHFTNVTLSFYAATNNGVGQYDVAPFAISANAETKIANVSVTGSLTVDKNNDSDAKLAAINVYAACTNEESLNASLFAGLDLSGFRVIDNTRN